MAVSTASELLTSQERSAPNSGAVVEVIRVVDKPSTRFERRTAWSADDIDRPSRHQTDYMDRRRDETVRAIREELHDSRAKTIQPRKGTRMRQGG